jgi:hypothetical protein
MMKRFTTGVAGLAMVMTMPALAQTTASAMMDDDTIVVTARKRAEDIQTVPLAITAFSAKDLGTSINSDYHGAEVFWRCDVSDAAGSGRFWPVLSRLVADFLSFGRSYPMAARRSWKTSRSML